MKLFLRYKSKSEDAHRLSVSLFVAISLRYKTEFLLELGSKHQSEENSPRSIWLIDAIGSVSHL